MANDRAEKDMLERTLAQNDKLNKQLEEVTKERNDMYKTVCETRWKNKGYKVATGSAGKLHQSTNVKGRAVALSLAAEWP